MVKHVIIMAGGAGKRLWPESCANRPKQFMQVMGDKSLFGGTLERAAALGIEGRIVVVTNQKYKDLTLKEFEIFPEELQKRCVVLCEPRPRNTSPALMYAARWLAEFESPEDTALVLAADHIITEIDKFSAAVEAASSLAEKGFIVPFGIVPQSPETGYGYIEAGDSDGEGYEVHSFKEKPDKKTAEEFLAAGNFYWNSGMFVYSMKVFLAEMEKHTPEQINAFASLTVDDMKSETAGLSVCSDVNSSVEKAFDSAESISIDYALMEKTKEIRAVKGMFSWNDVGSWDVIADLYPREVDTAVEAKGNYVLSDIPVSICGVDDLIVVARNGKLLICRKGKSQLVKEAALKDE